MKVFALFALLALVACASAHGDSADREVFLAQANQFVGELQESEDSPVESIGIPSNENPTDPDTAMLAGGFFNAVPSCQLPLKFGMPICIAKCISLGHVAGYCAGSKCNCVG